MIDIHGSRLLDLNRLPQDESCPGNFTFFGFSQNFARLRKQSCLYPTGCEPGFVSLGTGGFFFYYSTYADIAESEQGIVIKLGLARTPSKAVLTSQMLRENGIFSASRFNWSQLAGNAAIALFDRQTQAITMYQTLLSVAQFYYTSIEEGIICSDSLRILKRIVGKFEINEPAIPMHFLFRLIPGPQTYYQGVNRLCPGQYLRWTNGEIKSKTIHTLNDFGVNPELNNAGSDIPGIVHESLKAVLRTYIDNGQASGGQFANSLSGGVDSSLIQSSLNELRSAGRPLRSFSYSMLTPGYRDEMNYASQARQSLHTQHTVVEIKPEDYLGLLVETIETASYPSLCVETDPCVLALLKHIQSEAPGFRYLFGGHGADALFGSRMVRKLLLLDAVRRLPGAGSLLKVVAWPVEPLFPKKADGLREIASMLPELKRPDSFNYPANFMNVYTDVDLARRCFGDQAVLEALKYRRDYLSQYLNTSNPMEQVQTIELLTWDFEAAVFENQLALACGIQKWYPFLDEDIVRLAYSLNPAIRYIKGTTAKYILKQILAQKKLPGIANNPKRGGVFVDDLYGWMKKGYLRDRVQSIRRPGYISQIDFQKLIETPSPFLWELLILDIFQEKIVSSQ